MQTVVFNKVFKEEGVSPKGRAWVRFDYKTADGGRFPHFAATQEIPLDTAVNVQTSAKGDIKSWEVVGGSVPAETQQTSPGSSEGSQGASGAYNAPQGPSVRDTQIHRQTATKVAAKLLDFFPKAEQDLDTFWVVTEQLVDYYQNGVA